MNTQRTWVFSPLDLIMPIGVSVAAVTLCVLGFIKAEDTPAKVVTALTGAVFLAMIPAWYFVRSIKRRYHHLVAGMCIVHGKLNTPDPRVIESWFESLVKHWSSATWRSSGQPVSVSEGAIRRGVEELSVFFLDQEKISLLGKFVRGYAWGKDCVVGFRLGEPKYTESLFKHEVSHHILVWAGEPWDEKRHHAIFQITNLGA